MLARACEPAEPLARPARLDGEITRRRISDSGRAMRILGVDPGIRGGLAIVLVNDGTAPTLIDAIDIPVAGVGAKERVDVLAIRTWIRLHQPDRAVIERAQAMPKQGASSGFKYGRAVGAIEGALACCEVPMEIIEPTKWKKAHHLRGGDKESGRQRSRAGRLHRRPRLEPHRRKHPRGRPA